MTLNYSDMIDLVHGASEEIVKPTGMRVERPYFVRRRSGYGTVACINMQLPKASIDTFEIHQNINSASGFYKVVIKSLFLRITDAYRYFVEHLGMKPIYYIEPRRDQDYLDGFVA